MKKLYEIQNFRAKTKEIIVRANDIIEDMESQGYKLSLRQLYYSFVSKDWIPNTDKSYSNLGAIITKARLNGNISWTAIEDRGRISRHYLVQESRPSVIAGTQYDISYDLWERQDSYVEVWVEKDALSGVIKKPCNKYRVPYMACKGYMSSSAAWNAGQRFKEAREAGKKCILIHLGDHDPSGIDMTRDNDARLEMFSEGPVEVRRIALNMDQIRHYNPPPNPTKFTDSSATGYVAEHGDSSWELDALEPRVMDKLIEDEIRSIIDFDKWDKTKQLQVENRAVLENLSNHWGEVEAWLEENHPLPTYDEDGYDQNGYNRYGYNIDGYDSDNWHPVHGFRDEVE